MAALLDHTGWLEEAGMAGEACGQDGSMAGSRPLSLASSLAASIGSSLGSAGDLAGVLTRSSSSSSSSGGSAELPAVAALQGGPAPRQHGMAAPVPYRTAESISACRLLRNYSSFDGLEVPALHQAAAAADAAASAPPRTGPPPDVLLAALSASLAAQKQARQLQPSRGPQQPLRPTAPLPAPPAAYGARPAFACATCSCAFTDAAAYHEHCASLEHTLNILQCSLALAVPHMPAQAAGLCASPSWQQAYVTEPAAGDGQPGSGPLAASPPNGGPPPFSRTGQLAACWEQGSLLRPSSSTTLTLEAWERPASASSLPPAAGLGPHGTLFPAADQLASLLRQPLAAAPASGVLPTAPPAPAALPLAPVSLTPCLNQVIDPQLDALCHALVKKMRQLDGVERAVSSLGAAGSRSREGSPGPIAVRRIVGGLREVRKAVRNGTAAAIISAVDIQANRPSDAQDPSTSPVQPGAEMAEICRLAAAHGIPVVFALTRIGLGSIFAANKRMSAVALTNITGVEALVQHVLQLAAQARAKFALVAHAPKLYWPGPPASSNV